MLQSVGFCKDSSRSHRENRRDKGGSDGDNYESAILKETHIRGHLQMSAQKDSGMLKAGWLFKCQLMPNLPHICNARSSVPNKERAREKLL